MNSLPSHESWRALTPPEAVALLAALRAELELMLEVTDREFWVFRRDPRITCPVSRAIRRNPEGIAYLAPEIQLLYKARATRARDQVDFDHVVPHLDRDARTWLRNSLPR